MQSDSRPSVPQNLRMDVLSTHSSPRIGYFVAEESARYSDAQPAIYLDTTIVSYLTAGLSYRLLIAHHQLITRRWWNEYRHLHALWSSSVMLDEAAKGNAVASAARMAAVTEVGTLIPDSQSQRLAEKLVGGGRLPEKAQIDAEHVAIAATNSIPLLLTWNCKHLANPYIHRKIVQACEAEGFRCPEICTPEDLMRTYTHAKSTHR
jgi:hypothetical protein